MRACHPALFRVIISAAGDLIVRPSFLEVAARRGPHSSIIQHLLVSYCRSFGAVLRQQVSLARTRVHASSGGRGTCDRHSPQYG